MHDDQVAPAFSHHSLEKLAQTMQQQFGEQLQSWTIERDELTVEVAAEHLLEVASQLHSDDAFHFEQLIDLCGVDYSTYGCDEWATEEATSSGFSRGVDPDQPPEIRWTKPRFAVVYHLMSYTNNERLRLRVFVDEDTMMVPSVTRIWSSANWFEREAFDLFGILFEGHNDLRRILTDYGFIGHPFRKDFPLIGNVELRYDAAEGRCVYEPVSIEPRTLVARVIRREGEQASRTTEEQQH